MAGRRLIPGLAVATPPPVAADAMPRMDVALLIGFAERGPVHRPVMLESADQFSAVFGGDFQLARDADGTLLQACLPAAVRAYFANGGTRAWVVRVCRTEASELRWHGFVQEPEAIAVARTFSIPNVTADGNPFIVRASSLGGWANDMRVSARVDKARGTAKLRLRAEIGGEYRELGPYGLAPDDPDSWWREVDDDTWYADPAAAVGLRPALAASGTPAPIDVSGLSEFWSTPVAPAQLSGERIVHDGLSRYDAELFLDPLYANLDLGALATLVEARDDGQPPLGIHALLTVPGGAEFAEPSLVAVPDAIHPGWTKDDPAAVAGRDFALPTTAPLATPPNWRDHAGACLPPGEAPLLVTPDSGRFLDCTTRLLPAPVFAPVPSPAAVKALTLTWTRSDPGSIYVLEQASRADFSDALEIWRGPEPSHVVPVQQPGPVYFRLHAELAGNVSSAVVLGVLVADNAWRAKSGADADGGTATTVQAALLRLCAAIGDQLAVLALPAWADAEAAIAHVDRLRATLAQTPQVLSFGALFHPWLCSTRADGELFCLPPEGAVAATMARHARQRGVWIAPARLAFADSIALAPAIADADRSALAGARINLLRAEPQGFMASDALTLSDDFDWDEINVRRLVSLVRRAAIRTGAPFVFEPDGDTLRRSIERRFSQMLGELERRGAFAGRGGEDSWRLWVGNSESDRANGRLVIEIAIAPSRPLRFLTLVLSRTGERFTVAEER